jgi:hypothetical protein
MKNECAVIKLNASKVVAQLVMTQNEYDVLKLALKHYANGYGLALLKRIEKAEQ